MSNITIKTLTPEKPIPMSNDVIKKHDRCVACGLRNVLREFKGFWYCVECLAYEEKLDSIVEYNTDFSSPDPLENEKSGEI